MCDSRMQGLFRRYFNWLLKHSRLILALYLAAELRSREMCHVLATAADALEGDRARFVAVVAREAYRSTPSVTVGFV